MAKLSPQEFLNGLRVRVGLLAAVLVVVLAHPTWLSLLQGFAVALLGLLIRAWASGHLRKEKELAVSGPYKYSRNPLYLGNFILGIGIVLGARSWWVLGVFAAYFLVFYPLIIRKERERMKELFSEQYEEYGKRVPLFFPSLRRRTPPAQVKFSWALYEQNKEYRAFVGTVVFWLFLAAKILLLNR